MSVWQVKQFATQASRCTGGPRHDEKLLNDRIDSVIAHLQEDLPPVHLGYLICDKHKSIITMLSSSDVMLRKFHLSSSRQYEEVGARSTDQKTSRHT